MKYYYCQNCKRWVYLQPFTVIRCSLCGKELLFEWEMRGNKNAKDSN